MKHFFTLLALFAMIPGTASAKDAPLETVPFVDLQKYQGQWYEVARLEQRFQKGCINSTATYSFRDDGDIRVVNECEIAGKNKRKNKRKKATGRAWVKDKETNAKLRVQFVLTGIKLSFLSGKYWVLDLGDKYSHVMIGDPSRDYFWLLARTPTLEPQLFDELVQKAGAMGFPVEELLINPSQAALQTQR